MTDRVGSGSTRIAVSRRGAIAGLMGGGALLARPGLARTMLVRPAMAGLGPIRLTHGELTLSFDSAMRSQLWRGATALTGVESGEALRLADGTIIDQWLRLNHREAAVSGVHGLGCAHRFRATAGGRVEQTLTVTLLDRYPGLALVDIVYLSTSRRPLAIAGWHAGRHDLLPHGNGAWTFAGASYADRRDWIQPVTPGFDQRNFMGMNASDYGGGTPMAVVWRRDAGLALGHVETVPRLVSLPVAAQPGGTRLAMVGDQPVLLEPGESLVLPKLILMVHGGDHFQPLDAYRRVMADRGLAAPAAPAASYAPIWCAWGYERNFTTDQIIATLPKAKQLGLEWAVLDDGWQTSEGDWQVDRAKFPRGDADMKAFADRIKAAGMKPRLWFSPLAADPGTDLLRDHSDMLLLDRDGAAQNVSWWNSFTLCPAYPPTIDHYRRQVRRIVGEWGFEGLKLDGQHLNGVAPCYNPAHHHARPEESFEKLQDFWKALYDEAIAINPDAVIEICPCGDSFAFHNIPAMNNTPASDPTSSWQVRLKGKTFKALIGPSAPFSGDHVELSDGHQDFASSYGVGAILSTKFTWPQDSVRTTEPLPPGGYKLTPEREVVWRKWIDLYRAHMLPKGRYLGSLYDIGFDKPEGHAIAKDGALHYAFFADHWNGPIELRGLDTGLYRLTEPLTGKDLGTAGPTDHRLTAKFDHALLVEARPMTGNPAA